MRKIVITLLAFFVFVPSAWGIDLDLYTMSQCPYGTEFENTLITFFDKFPELKKDVKVTINYIGEEKKSADGKIVFECLHGPAEVRENMRQLVIAKHWPDKLFTYLKIRNTDIRSSEWKAAAILAGLGPRSIRKHKKSEGEKLLSQSIAQSKKIGARSSPTIYINGKLYEGGRGVPALLRAFARHQPNFASAVLRDIGECGSDLDCQREGEIGRCRNPNSQNAECAYEEVSPVKCTVLTAKEKVFADLTNLKSWLKDVFPGIEIEETEYDSAEGKKLTEEYSLDALPVFILDEGAKNYPRFAEMKKQKIFVARKDKFLLAERFAPPNFYFKRKRVPNELVLFTMSQCPYGTEVENALINNPVSIKIHFIAEEKKGAAGFESFHGITEVEEDLRQVCMMKHYPDRYFAYLRERNGDIKSSWWEDAVIKAGVDRKKIKTCAQGEEGGKLLRENVRITNLLDVRVSPTFLWENQIRLNSVEEFKKIPQFKGLKIAMSGGSCRSR